MINRQVLTLDEFTIREMRAFPKATGELAGLLRNIGLAAKRVNVEVNKPVLLIFWEIWDLSTCREKK